MRAARVVIDTGVHIDGWSLEEAKQYLLAQTGISEDLANSEISRMHYPTSQLAYKIGELRFQAMRKRVARKLGSGFDLRNFHDAMLLWGPLPFDVLQRKIEDCPREPDCILGSPQQ